MRLTEQNHAWFKSSLQKGHTVVDATLGNGFDALFLAQCIGEHGHIYGFDVQSQAIQQSQQRLALIPCHQTFYRHGHEHLATALPAHCQGNIQGIMFNLGWLPGSDKSIITQPQNTISALQQSFTWLAENGKLSVMLYPGHQGGDSEACAVMQWVEHHCTQNKGSFQWQKIEVAHKPNAPILLQIMKKSAA